MLFIYPFYIFFSLTGARLSRALFPLKRVHIRGAISFSPEHIMRLSGIEPDASLFSINRQNIQKNIESEPRLKFISMQKKYPSALIINISELDGDLIIINNENNTVFYTVSRECTTEGCPVIEQSSFPAVCDRIYLTFDEPGPFAVKGYAVQKNITELIKSMSSLPKEEKDLLGSISQIRICQSGDIILYPRDLPLKINIGYNASLEKLRQARYSLLYADSRQISAGLIDLRFEPARIELKRG